MKRALATILMALMLATAAHAAEYLEREQTERSIYTYERGERPAYRSMENMRSYSRGRVPYKSNRPAYKADPMYYGYGRYSRSIDEEYSARDYQR